MFLQKPLNVSLRLIRNCIILFVSVSLLCAFISLQVMRVLCLKFVPKVETVMVSCVKEMYLVCIQVVHIKLFSPFFHYERASRTRRTSPSCRSGSSQSGGVNQRRDLLAKDQGHARFFKLESKTFEILSRGPEVHVVERSSFEMSSLSACWLRGTLKEVAALSPSSLVTCSFRKGAGVFAPETS